MYNMRMPLEQSTFKRQAAAIPFRVEGGKAEILLIRRKGRPWGIPKGSIEPGHTPRECALNEAEEEAGLHGELLEEPLGEFVYEKQFGEMLVTVYAMRVTQADEQWQEQSFRERRWFGIEQALSQVGRRDLQPMIAKLGRILSSQF
jgi:8-oxo-dGTP pyrophosphatase MutT (NUDIX family)